MAYLSVTRREVEGGRGRRCGQRGGSVRRRRVGRGPAGHGLPLPPRGYAPAATSRQGAARTRVTTTAGGKGSQEIRRGCGAATPTFPAGNGAPETGARNGRGVRCTRRKMALARVSGHAGRRINDRAALEYVGRTSDTQAGRFGQCDVCLTHRPVALIGDRYCGEKCGCPL